MSQKGAEVFEMLLSVCCHLHHKMMLPGIDIGCIIIHKENKTMLLVIYIINVHDP